MFRYYIISRNGPFLFLLKITGKYSENVQLLSWYTLNNKIKNNLSVTVVSDAVCKWPCNLFKYKRFSQQYTI